LTLRRQAVLFEVQIPHISGMHRMDFSGLPRRHHWLLNAQLYEKSSSVLTKQTLEQAAHFAVLPKFMHCDYREGNLAVPGGKQAHDADQKEVKVDDNQRRLQS
jgi:hypothetical protein